MSSGDAAANHGPVHATMDTENVSSVLSPLAPSRDKDPLYMALLGSKLGAAIGPAEHELELNTLDELVSESIVSLLLFMRVKLMLTPRCM